MPFYDYKWMLDRAMEQAKKSGSAGEVKFEWPKADVLIQGSKTIIRNFTDIADAIQRKPLHLMKALSREFGSPGNIDGKRLFFTGRFSTPLVNTKIDAYVKEFVFCPSCHRHETSIIKQDRIDVLKCNACGATNSIRTLK